MKKNIFLLSVLLLFLFGCKQNQLIKTHGVAYLEKREKLIEKFRERLFSALTEGSLK